MNTISVWLNIKSGEHAGKWVLQQRSTKNKNFPLVCQPTWAGKVEEGETIEDALHRECAEELGETFFKAFNFTTLVMVKKTHYARDEKMWEVYNFVGSVDGDILKKAVLNDEACPDFILVDKDTHIYPLNLKKDPRENIVLFDDQFTVFYEIARSN